MFVRLQKQRFTHDQVLAELTGARTDVGAVASFTGLVRDMNKKGNPVHILELEHYPSMAQAQLEHLATTAIERFDLLDAAIIHRYGRLTPADPIVLVIALSAHRQAAFDAAQMMMDGLKVGAPFWKKEIGSDGQNPDGQWVKQRDCDVEAAQKWTKSRTDARNQL